MCKYVIALFQWLTQRGPHYTSPSYSAPRPRVALGCPGSSFPPPFHLRLPALSPPKHTENVL